MKDLKDREIEARAMLAERLKRLRSEMIRRPAGGASLPGSRLPRPRPRVEPEQPNWWWQR